MRTRRQFDTDHRLEQRDKRCIDSLIVNRFRMRVALAVHPDLPARLRRDRGHHDLVVLCGDGSDERSAAVLAELPLGFLCLERFDILLKQIGMEVIEEEVLDDAVFFLCTGGVCQQRHAELELLAGRECAHIQNAVIIALKVRAERACRRAVGVEHDIRIFVPLIRHPEIDLALVLRLKEQVERLLGFGLQEQIHGRIRRVGIGIGRIPAGFTESSLFAVCVLIALIQTRVRQTHLHHLIGERHSNRRIILVPVIKAAACGEGRVAGNGGKQNILTVERIVVSECIDAENILTDHIADVQRIRIFEHVNDHIRFRLCHCMILIDPFIRRADVGIDALFQHVLVCIALVKDILDAEHAVCKRRIALISGEIRAGRIAHGFNEGQDLCVHDGAGMRDAAQTEARVIVDGTDVGLFCSVKAVVIIGQLGNHVTAALDIFAVGFSGGIADFRMNIFKFTLCIVGQLCADDRQHTDRNRQIQSLGKILLAHQHDEDAVNRQQRDRDPDRLVGIEIHDALHVQILLLVNEHQKNEHDREAAAEIRFLNAGCIAQRHGSHAQHDEREDEGIAEREPVRHLSAVPDHVDRSCDHADEHEDGQECITDLFVPRNALVQEEQRCAEEREHAAVDLRLAFDVDGVILIDTELRDEFQRRELPLHRPVRLGEIELAECQRIVDRQDHERGTCDCNGRGQRHAAEHDRNFLAVLRCQKCLVRTEADIEEEIDRGEDAAHKADIEVCDAHHRERNDEIQLSAVIHKVLDAEHDQRQENQTVQPHRVDRLDNAVSTHAEHRAEHEAELRLDMLCFSDIIAECHGCHAQLAEYHDQQGAEQHGARQQNHDQRKGTGQIIADDTLIAAGQIARPVIQNAAVPVKRITDRFKIVDILAVQVKTQHGVLPERIHSEECICNVDQRNRQRKSR